MQLKFNYFDEVTSTNSTLKADREAREGTVLLAKLQTSGRGTGSNQWESEKAQNITGSIVFEPTFLEPANSFLVSMAISVGIATFLNQYSNEVKIKWPNDIYIKNKKIGGILIENEFTASAITRTIAGIGLNINQTRFITAPNPTSLSIVTGKHFNLGIIEKELFNSINKQYLQLKKDKELVYQNYHALLYGKNKLLHFEDIHGRFSGQIQQVDYDGRLTIKDSQNDIRHYYFKEVTFLH